MLAIVAAACFLLALFGVELGGVDLMELGHLFLAGHLAWTFNVVPSRYRRE